MFFPLQDMLVDFREGKGERETLIDSQSMP